MGHFMSMLYNKIKIEIDINNDDLLENHIIKHHENKNREKGAYF
jgi:hypothetical protein